MLRRLVTLLVLFVDHDDVRYDLWHFVTKQLPGATFSIAILHYRIIHLQRTFWRSHRHWPPIQNYFGWIDYHCCYETTYYLALLQSDHISFAFSHQWDKRRQHLLFWMLQLLLVLDSYRGEGVRHISYMTFWFHLHSHLFEHSKSNNNLFCLKFPNTF